MQRKLPTSPLLFDPEIARLERAIQRQKKQNHANAAAQGSFSQPEFIVEDWTSQTSEDSARNSTMDNREPENQNHVAENLQPRRTLGDYAYQQGPRHFNSILAPPFTERVVELKPALLNLIASHPFSGLDHEDPYTHLSTFMELCSTMGTPDADAEAVYMRAFPFSLTGKAKIWLQSHPNRSLNTWGEVEEKFIARFFPPSRFISAKSAIATFCQGADEPLCETWERFKALLRRCPNHGFDDAAQLHIFYSGLRPQTKMILDASAGGTMMSKSPEEAVVIIDSIAASDFQSHHDRAPVQKKGIYELDTQNALLAQNKLLTQQLEALTKQIGQLSHQGVASKPQPVHHVQQLQQGNRCDFCGVDHPNGCCSTQSEYNQGEEAHYVQNQGFQQQNYQGFRPPQNSNQPYGWKPLNSQFANPTNQPYAGSSSNCFAGSQNRAPFQPNPPPPNRLSKMEDTLTQFMQASMTNQKNTEASIKNLEVQVGQLAKQLAEQRTDSFSANTQVNPKEQCKAIVTRSGKVIGKEHIEAEEMTEGERQSKKEQNDPAVESELEKSTQTDETPIKAAEDSKKLEKSPPVQHLPYPHAPSKKDKERQYKRFLDIFKQLHINIPFSEALDQMPTYAKFLKEILTKKRRWEDEETVQLAAGCSAIIQKAIPEKSRDPGSFTIPVTIGKLNVERALLDLGASINLMPLSMVKRIGDVEIRPTRMALQLADRTIKHPHGIVEDVLVKVDKFFFPVDFVVMDMDEDNEVPLILGRPFMKTAKVIIDVDEGKLKVRVQEEELQFDMFEALKHPAENSECSRVDVLDHVWMETQPLAYNADALVAALIEDSLGDQDKSATHEYIQQLKARKEISKQAAGMTALIKKEDDEKPALELKSLRSQLKYSFLGAEVSQEEEEQSIAILEKNSGAMEWRSCKT